MAQVDAGIRHSLVALQTVETSYAQVVHVRIFK